MAKTVAELVVERLISWGVVDATEPPMPGKVTTVQAWHFAEALARGQEDHWEILKTIAKNTVREVM